MKLKKILSLTLTLLIGLVIGMAWSTHRYRKEYRDIEEIIRAIEEYSYYFNEEELTRKQLLEGALRGIVGELKDPYSIYLDSEELKNFYESIQAEYAGVGIVIAQAGDYSLIVEVIDHSPAKDKLFAGDVLLAVDNESVVGLTIEEIGKRVRGEAGTVRHFLVYREGKEETVEVILEKVTMATVTDAILEVSGNRIGYVKVTQFATNTAQAFEDALTKLKSENITDVIIDIRDNPGGLLSAVKNMLDLLTDKNEPLLFVKEWSGNLIPHIQNRYQAYDFNLYVLINENSASASEIFAATLNELEGVPLIGKTTFGKGTMQALFPLNEAETKAVKLTINAWLTPKKNFIHEVGVKPTVEVEQAHRFDFLDYQLQIELDTVNLQAVPLQRFLNRTQKNARVREDGYIDKNTLDALKQYQQTIPWSGEGNEAAIDFRTVYYINREIIEQSKQSCYDSQLQAAIQLILKDKAA